MYYATGLPGWMRLGYSPGWVGRSPSGLGPCAQYSMTGQWPGPVAPGAAMPQGMYPGAPGPQQQLEMLKSQADLLEQQLAAVRRQIAQTDGAE